jgi:general secretion pathway protein K
MSAGNNRGVALLITLTAITMIIAVALELNRQMRQSLTSAATTKNHMVLVHMVNAGVETGKAILAKDKNDTESVSVQDEWANPEIIESYLAQLPFENGGIKLEISDERSRIQLNSLVKFPEGRDFNPHQHELWQRFFAMMLAGMEMHEQDLFQTNETITPDMIINPIKDWLDSGDDDAITGLTGAENDYYQGLDPPYGIRNGPFKHITELMRVKNITKEMFYSLDIDNYVTVYGMTPVDEDQARFTYDGKINLNTAEMPVIAALLPDGYEFIAEEIVSFREESVNGSYINDLSGATWYKSVLGAEEIDINPELITTTSDHFRIVSNAEFDGMRLSATVIVLREQDEETGKPKCSVLSWSYSVDEQ